MANLYVSNGTCYIGAGASTDVMIPCGNAYFGHVGCCQASDICLTSSVCFNAEHGTTYVTGCTDPEYGADVCPDKFDDTDAPWLGMAYCNGTSNEWLLCDQQGHPATIQKGDPCWCATAATDRSMTLSEFSAIQATATLPRATSSTITWVADFYPTTPAAFASSQTASAAAAAATATDTAHSELAPFPTAAGLSTAAKIGTAIGATVFGLLLLAALGVAILRCRSGGSQPAPTTTAPNAGADDKAVPGDASPAGASGPRHPATQDPRTMGGVAYCAGVADEWQQALGVGAAPSPRASVVSQRDNKAARPWSGLSELDGGYAGAGAGLAHLDAMAEASHGLRVGGSAGYARPLGRHHRAPAELDAPLGRPAELPACMPPCD